MTFIESRFMSKILRSRNYPYIDLNEGLNIYDELLKSKTQIIDQRDYFPVKS